MTTTSDLSPPDASPKNSKRRPKSTNPHDNERSPTNSEPHDDEPRPTSAESPNSESRPATGEPQDSECCPMSSESQGNGRGPDSIEPYGDERRPKDSGRRPNGNQSRPYGKEARPRGSDFAPLSRLVRERGLLERRTAYYVRAIGLNVLGTVALWVGVALLGGSWWVVLLAPAAALLSARTGFLGHDAGHRQIARSARANRILGLFLGNLMLGLSHGWWNAKHDRHHANPNHVDKDPDVRAGLLVWTQGQAEGRTGLSGWFTRHQAALFFPLLLLEGISLQVDSILDLRNRSPRERRIEGILLAAHAIGYLSLAFTFMSPATALVFMAVHQGLFGLHLGCAFAPNHKGMPMPAPGERWDHLRRQVLTSRNVRGGPVTDWLLGGLNYQIEHHLFPGVPRPSLRTIQPLVRAHCTSLGLPYTEDGLLGSYRRALSHMHEVGGELRGH